MSETRLSEYDFMELVAFDSKVENEGFSYAAEEYSPRFERDGLKHCDDFNVLRDLLREYRDELDTFWKREDACDVHNAHQMRVRKRFEDMCLWGVKRRDGYVIPCATEETTRYYISQPDHFHPVALMRRESAAAAWEKVRDIEPAGGESGVK